MNDGARQDQRMPEALAPSTILVDEIPLHVRLAMIRDYAAALTFLDSDDPERAGRLGTWSDLLDGDGVILIARCLSLRLDERERLFLDDFAASRVPRMARRLAELAGWLSDWLEHAARLPRPQSRAIGEQIERQVVSVLSPDWKTVVGGSAPDSAMLAATGITSWIAPLTHHGGSQAAAAGRTTPTAPGLRVMFFALLEALRGVQIAAARELEGSLKNRMHEPAAALLLALTRTYERIQDRINGFTERHLDFYYHDYLGQAPRPAQPDSVHLILERDPTFTDEVVIPAGQVIEAGLAASGEPILFETDAPMRVTDARVASLRTLRLERDAAISPEHEFHFVTRAKVAEFGADIGPESVLERDAAALMGGNVLGCIPNDRDARIGLAICAPILRLKEGERRIDLTLELAFAGDAPDAERLVAKLVKAKDHEAFHRDLGELFSAWLLRDGFGLTDGHLDQIRAAAPPGKTKPFIDPTRLAPRAEAVASDHRGGEVSQETLASFASDPLFQLLGEMANVTVDRRRKLARSDLFAAFFKAEISTAKGWAEIHHAIAPFEAPEDATPRGFVRLWLDLTNEDPPSVACTPGVHGADWSTDDPVLRLTLREQSRMFPFSLFDAASLAAVTIAVRVAGLRELMASNQFGRLDPGKPFQPFGPLPDTAAFLVIAAPEAAQKQVTNFELTLEWAGLPPQGFAQHYAGYGGDLTDDSFAVTPSILRDGRWSVAGGEQRLFAVDGGLLRSTQRLSLDPHMLRAFWRPTDQPLAVDGEARNALLKLQLTSPPEGFGQTLYPHAVSNALRESLRKKNATPVVLNPPYAPVLTSLTLNYRAQMRVQLGGPPPVKPVVGDARILHLHPFGIETVHPRGAADHLPPVLPSFRRDGQLMIGLAASDPQGELTLLFEMREDTASERVARDHTPPPPEWSYLCDDAWRPIDQGRIVMDTTKGFLTTGIVKIDLPPGLTSANSLLPPGLFWLQVATNRTSDAFAGLQGVHAQALLATRILDGTPATLLAPETITLNSVAVPGLLSLRQPATSFGLRPAENAAQERTRIGERLRHKGRASTPWDYERLVLEAFPNVYKVKCLANTSPIDGEPSAGDVLVVVAPAPPRKDPAYRTRALQLDAVELDEIASALPPLASPFARITVRNATYERVQVRCVVRLEHGARFGDVLRRINVALVDFLSPWHDGGYAARFDWTIRGDDIEACIRAVEQVRSVASVSLIRIWEDDQAMTNPFYHFEDTAAPRGAPQAGTSHPVVLSALRPWSLVLPLEEHIIEVLETNRGKDAPHPTGVAGATLLVGSGDLAGLKIGTTWVVKDVLP